MGKDGGMTILCITWHGWTIQQKSIFLRQHNTKFSLEYQGTQVVQSEKETICQQVYYNWMVYLGINEGLQLSKSSYRGAVRQIRLIVLHMQIRIK